MLIARKLVQSGSTEEPPSVESIAELAEQKADNLRSLSVAKRVAASMCTAHRASRELILDRWESEGLGAASEAALAHLEEEVQELKGRLKECIAEAEEEVDKDWNSKKLKLVPGSELLDSVFKSYNLRFKKDRDSATLAVLIGKDNVVPEIAALLTRICRQEPLPT